LLRQHTQNCASRTVLKCEQDGTPRSMYCRSGASCGIRRHTSKLPRPKNQGARTPSEFGGRGAFLRLEIGLAPAWQARAGSVRCRVARPQDEDERSTETDRLPRGRTSDKCMQPLRVSGQGGLPEVWDWASACMAGSRGQLALPSRAAPG